MFKSKTALIILLFCSIKLALHLVADYNSGFQGDELLHIETGNHPALGYMEFPPVIGWIAFIQNQFNSSSVFVHHIFTHLASLLIIILTALITIELGGKTKAVFLVLLCIVVAPAFGRGHQLFQPVVFSQLCWVLAFYQLVRFGKNLDSRYIGYLTLVLIFGFWTKYDILFFIAGLAGLLFFKRTRLALADASPWKYILLFLILISPTIQWQFQHQFPALQMFSRLYETQLDKLTVSGVLKDLLVPLNPLTSVIWIGGLVYMFNEKDKETYRPLAVCIVLSLCFLAFSRSKAYYFYPAMLTLLSFGSIWFEHKILSTRKWVLYPTAILLVLSGIIMMPFGLAVLPLGSFIKFSGSKREEGRYHIHYQEYYSQSKWQHTLSAIKSVYDSLPETEKTSCMIWGKHYSQAGAVNLYGSQYGLPKAFSYHGSFYLWAPEGAIPQTILAFTNGEAEIDFFRNYFNTVLPVKQIYSPYADFDKDLWQTIYICKNPTHTFTDLKRIFKSRVFE